MPSLSRLQFHTQDSPLPGMEAMRPAEPHEQTESQFLNRPDVMWHGRFEDARRPRSMGPVSRSWDFHVGTEKAAVDRLQQLGHRWGDAHEPRFYAGRVDPSKMQNTPNDPNVDKGEDWDDWEDKDTYYLNEHEDAGSVSALIGTNRQLQPTNFRSWRGAVSQALRDGVQVPRHVKSLYWDTGGERGSRTYTHTNYVESPPSPRSARFRQLEESGRLAPSAQFAVSDSTLLNPSELYARRFLVKRYVDGEPTPEEMVRIKVKKHLS